MLLAALAGTKGCGFGSVSCSQEMLSWLTLGGLTALIVICYGGFRVRLGPNCTRRDSYTAESTGNNALWQVLLRPRWGEEGIQLISRTRAPLTLGHLASIRMCSYHCAGIHVFVRLTGSFRP